MRDTETLIKVAAPTPRRPLDEEALNRRIGALHRRRVAGVAVSLSMAVVVVAVVAVNVQHFTVELMTPPADTPGAIGPPAAGGPPIADRQPSVIIVPDQGFAISGAADPPVAVPGRLPAAVFDNVGQVGVEAPGRMGLHRWDGQAWEPVDGWGQLEFLFLYTLEPGEQLRLDIDQFALLPHIELPAGWYRASMTFSQAGEPPLPSRAVRTVHVPFQLQPDHTDTEG